MGGAEEGEGGEWAVDKLKDLAEEARRLGRHRTRAAAIRVALQEYIQRRNRMKIIDAFGTIDFDPDYDYKKHR